MALALPSRCPSSVLAGCRCSPLLPCTILAKRPRRCRCCRCTISPRFFVVVGSFVFFLVVARSLLLSFFAVFAAFLSFCGPLVAVPPFFIEVKLSLLSHSHKFSPKLSPPPVESW